MICKNCNTNLFGNVDFCPNCGAKIKKNKINKKLILLILGILLIIFATFIFVFFTKKDKSNYSKTSSSTFLSYSYTSNNKIKFIDGEFTDKLIRSSDDALLALESIKDKIGFKDIKNELTLNSKEITDDLTYYKFNQVYKGINVLDQNIIISVDKNNKVLTYSGYYIPDINIETTPNKSKEEIEEIVKKYLGSNTNILKSELNIWANYESQDLVYVINATSDTLAVSLILDANTGEILSESSLFDQANTYSYIGVGIDNITYTINLEEEIGLNGKNMYSFYDPVRKISIIDRRNEGQIFSSLASTIPNHRSIVVGLDNGKLDMAIYGEEFIQNAITTMANYETIYDYYKNVLGRNSFDNEGSKIYVNLGVTKSTFSNKDLNNAFWFSPTKQMYIGNWNGKSFSASLDVLAHEFTHGVIQHTANLTNHVKKEDKNKANETGALNEGISDVMGSLIEGKNWLIAENNEILRNLAVPNTLKHPSVKNGKYYYPDGYLTDGLTLEQLLEEHDLKYVTDYDKGGIHQNSTIVGHSAYLMYERGAFKNREEMAKVWYNALLMLSSNSNFEDCALAVIKSAKNLKLSSESIYKITTSFQDTLMLETKDHSLSGTITSADNKIKDAKIEIYAYTDNNLLLVTTSNVNGEYSANLPTGTYKIKVIKKDFKEFTTVVVIKGETKLNFNLASTSIKENTKENNCKTDHCYNFTVYFLEGSSQNKLKESYKTYQIEAGTVMDINVMVDSLNTLFGSNLITTNKESFYINMGEFKVEFAWYYKGTNTKYNWDTPVNEDVEIEMKLFDGLFDNDTLKDISNLFNRN